MVYLAARSSSTVRAVSVSSSGALVTVLRFALASRKTCLHLKMCERLASTCKVCTLPVPVPIGRNLVDLGGNPLWYLLPPVPVPVPVDGNLAEASGRASRPSHVSGSGRNLCSLRLGLEAVPRSHRSPSVR